ncbi:MAG: ATP synthase F0 subunit C [Desulfopila sp.]
MDFFTWSVIAAGFGMGIGSIGTGIGMGIAISKACEGVARNPGASGKILTNMMVGLALIESLAIYVFVICIIILYANPFTGQVVELLRAAM